MDFQACRVCAEKDLNSVSIFNQYENIQYSSMILRCVNIVIRENDGFPQRICPQCIANLSVTYQFIKTCKTTDDMLHSTDLKSSLPMQGFEQDIKLEIKFEEDVFSNCADETSMDELNHDHNDNTSAKTSKVMIKRHKIIHKKNKREKTTPLQCVVCGLLIISPSAMEIHSRTHTGEKPFHCPYCHASYPVKGSLKRHIETFHTERERKFTCETCGSSFYRKNDIITHMRRHTGEKPYACPFCPNRFLQLASLIRHKRTHTGDKPYSCSICSKKFADKSLVNKHMSVHSNEKKYTCQLCDKAMKTKNSLRAHMALHRNEKLNVCNFCGTAFSMKGNLKMHMMRVHSEKSGQCSVCMKTFSDLEVHMRKHTGEKPYECDVCSKAFSSKRSLSNHVQFKHERIAKYKCSIGDCGRTFPISTMLEFHLLKYHTNHTPFICQHCARGFFRTSDLSRHLRVSHAQHLPKPPNPPKPPNIDSTELNLQ